MSNFEWCRCYLKFILEQAKGTMNPWWRLRLCGLRARLLCVRSWETFMSRWKTYCRHTQLWVNADVGSFCFLFKTFFFWRRRMKAVNSCLQTAQNTYFALFNDPLIPLLYQVQPCWDCWTTTINLFEISLENEMTDLSSYLSAIKS